MPKIGLPSTHDWSASFDEVEGGSMTELGLDNASLPADLFPSTDPITGVRVTLHWIGEFGDGEASVNLDLNTAEQMSHALLELVAQQRGSDHG